MSRKRAEKRDLWKLMSETGLLQIHAEAVLKGKCSMEEALRRTRNGSLHNTGSDGSKRAGESINPH